MDVVQLTSHLDATAVRAAVAAPDAYLDREAREAVVRGVRAVSHQAAVVVLFEGSQHSTYDLSSSGCLRVGRSITADIQLEDPMVSRRHAVIEWSRESGVRVLDDRSLNGVLVNGDRVNMQRPLADGDEVQIADFVLRLVLND